MSSRLALNFLGPPHLHLDGVLIPAKRRKVVALIAYLAIEQGQHRRESLSALLWPDYSQSKAFANLRHTLWEIQEALGEGWLYSDREKIGLYENADIWVDVQQFAALQEQGKGQQDLPLRISLFKEAAKLYRNHFFMGVILKDASGFMEWVSSKSEELRYQFGSILTCLSEDYCSLGQAEQALPYARRLVTLNPLDESAHRRLMKVYVQAGQHSLALKQYQTCEEVLRKELNLDPQPETHELYKQIRRGMVKPPQTEEQIETKESGLKPPIYFQTSATREKVKEKFEIEEKTEHDPSTELFVPDAWLRWFLLAAEDTVGKLAVRVVLRKVGLDHLIGNYPPYEQPKPSKKFTFGDYSTLNAGLLDFLGRDATTQMLQIGRGTVKHSIMEQGALYGIGTINFPKSISFSSQIKMSMEVILDAARKSSQTIGQNHHVFLEDRGDKLAYINQDCAFCAGKESNQPMCIYLTGNLQEALHWLTGKEIYIEEVECRAMGAKACIWDIQKHFEEAE